MRLRFIPRVETRGYDVDRPCRDFLARKGSIDNATPFPGFPTPGKVFQAGEILLFLPWITRYPAWGY